MADEDESTTAYRWTHNPSRTAWTEARRPLGAVLHSSSEAAELLQLLCNDHSTTNTVIIIITITIADTAADPSTTTTTITVENFIHRTVKLSDFVVNVQNYRACK